MWPSLVLLVLAIVLGDCCASGLSTLAHNKRHQQISKLHAPRLDSNGTLAPTTVEIASRQLPACKTKICTSIKRGYRPFVVMRDGKMVLEDGTPFRFASFNAPDLLANNDNFEVEDTMRTIGGLGRGVARTYTLAVKGTSPHLGTGAHITGWDKEKNDWVYNEAMFQKMDNVLYQAYKHNVRLIIPIICQDYGRVASNWVGNYVDLIIHRKNPAWNYDTARTQVDFFKDPEMIEGYKKIVSFLLNRVNTITGIRYGDDPTILAWQTGNEMMYTSSGKTGPAPGAWTAAVAAHIKSLAPRTLVSDGSFARQVRYQDSHAPEALASPHVDLFCYYYYGTGEFSRMKTEPAYIQGFGKGFFVAEYGFVTALDQYKTLLDSAISSGAVGTLVWSLRSHSSKGGFRTHRENDATAAYHVPGWPNPLITPGSWVRSANWDDKEYSIVKYIRDASYKINGEPIPDAFPFTLPPKVWLNANRSLTWQGVAWAMSYEVWVSKPVLGLPVPIAIPLLDSQWIRIGQGLLDAVEAGTLAWPLPGDTRGFLKMRAIGVDGDEGPWSNIITVKKPRFPLLYNDKKTLDVSIGALIPIPNATDANVNSHINYSLPFMLDNSAILSLHWNMKLATQSRAE